MHRQSRPFLTLLNRLGLWIALPLLLAVLPYQQAHLQSPQSAAVSLQTPHVLAAGVKTSVVKPAAAEAAPRLILLPQGATPDLPPHRPGFRLLVTQHQTVRLSLRLHRAWQPRAPPIRLAAPLI